MLAVLYMFLRNYANIIQKPIMGTNRLISVIISKVKNMRIPFTKMQGVGNDFVVLTATDFPTDTNFAALAPLLCDRHTGVGGDGLIVVTPSPLTMQFWNPDGTLDMCGNGLRCTIHLAQSEGWVGESGYVQTPVGERAFRTQDGEIVADMGTPQVFPPLSLFGHALHLVDTGSDHVVIFVETLPSDEEFLALSPQIEHHPAFPNRTSVMWTQITTEGSLRIRIWERGVGETLGCGTGACAAAVAYWERENNRTATQVESSGGTLRVLPNIEGSIALSGPAQIVFTGVFEALPPPAP
jgi:diaminopimelate epimerase